MPDEKEAQMISDAVHITAAFASSEHAVAHELPGLLARMYAARKALEIPDPIVPEKAEALVPAVPIRASVKPDHVVCLECGQRLKMLKRHLSTDHDLTPEQYRSRWGLKADHPLVAPNYAEIRRGLALKIGLGRKSKPAAKKK